MFLNILALMLLLTVLAAKYFTSAHTSTLRQRQTELENLCRQNEQRGLVLKQERMAAEVEEKDVEGNISTTESSLMDLKQQLIELETRNEELEERITG